MKVLKVALAALCFSLGLGLMNESPAQQGDARLFVLRICNNSGLDALAAFVHKVSPTDNRWIIHGWYDIKQGCQELGTVPKGWFYYFALAKGGQGSWGGKSVNICVSARAFERIESNGGYTCKPDEELVGFEGHLIQSNAFEVTLGR